MKMLSVYAYATRHTLSAPSPLHQFVSNMIFHPTTVEEKAGESLSHVTIFIWSGHAHKVTKSEWVNPGTQSDSSWNRVEGVCNGFGNYPPNAFDNWGEALQKECQN